MTETKLTVIDGERKTKTKTPAAEEPKKPPQKSVATLYGDIADLINHSPLTPPQLGKFPYKWILCRSQSSDSDAIIVEVSRRKTSQNVCIRLSPETAASKLHQYLLKRHIKWADKQAEDPFDFHFTGLKCQAAIADWISQTARVRRTLPTGVSLNWSDDRGLSFWKLPYVLDRSITTLEDLERRAPHWHEILSRFEENADQFCVRVGSIFFDDADRKQAVYIYGPGDCGKSQIQDAIAHLAGAHSPERGGYAIMDSDDFKDSFGKEVLIGKRVVVISEASTWFLSTGKWKALSGDRSQSVNRKNKARLSIEIDSLFWFFSNNPPRIDGKPELIRRLICCGMRSPDYAKTPMIPENQYQKIIRAELPAFVAYCVHKYNEHGPGRIQVSMKGIETAIEEHESAYTAAFEKYFEVSPGNSLPAHMVYERLSSISSFVKYLNSSGKADLIECWKREYAIQHLRIRENGSRSTVFVGMKVKPLFFDDGSSGQEKSASTIPW
jgi:hypothetical protein